METTETIRNIVNRKRNDPRTDVFALGEIVGRLELQISRFPSMATIAPDILAMTPDDAIAWLRQKDFDNREGWYSPETDDDTYFQSLDIIIKDAARLVGILIDREFNAITDKVAQEWIELPHDDRVYILDHDTNGNQLPFRDGSGFEAWFTVAYDRHYGPQE